MGKMNKETHDPQAPASEQPKRKVAQEELAQILKQHRKWLESEGREGRRANLTEANPQGADLLGANLQGAYMRRANLQRANLQGAYLRLAEELTQKQVDSACGDAETKLPPGMFIKPCPEESN